MIFALTSAAGCSAVVAFVSYHLGRLVERDRINAGLRAVFETESSAMRPMADPSEIDPRVDVGSIVLAVLALVVIVLVFITS